LNLLLLVWLLVLLLPDLELEKGDSLGCTYCMHMHILSNRNAKEMNVDMV
jgi:hypothetical protein